MMLLQAGQLGLYRKDSIWTSEIPPDMVAGATLWLDGTDHSTLFDVSGTVPVTTDGTTVGVAINKANPSNWFTLLYTAPTLKNPAFNGKSALRFPAPLGTSGMGAANVGGFVVTTSNYVSTSNKLIFAAVKVASASPTAVNVWDNPAIFSDSSQYTGLHISDDGVSGFLAARAYNYSSGAQEALVQFPKDEYVVLTMSHQGGQLRMRVNGGAWAQTASGTTSDTLATTPLIGTWFTTPGMNLEIAHIAAVNTAQVDAAISAVEHWIALHLGITPWW